MKPESFDLIVIGGGPAGERAAATAGFFGKRVAIIEKSRDLGGAGANTGTLPSKTLRETALALSGLKARRLYGVDLSLRREATIADFMYHEKRVVAADRDRAEHNLARAHAAKFHGLGSFVDPHTVQVTRDGSVVAILRSERILIATGSSPARPDEFAFEHPLIHDSDGILNLKKLPGRLAVIGAGVIGSEYACTFAALGAQVHLIDGRDVLLSFLDKEISTALAAGMQELGIVFHWKQKVTVCKPGGEDVVVTLSSGETLTVDGVLVAAGRTSNTKDLNLAAAGITPDERGLIKVDAGYRTAVGPIYAAGDVIGFPALASTSMDQARVAMCHAFEKPYKSELVGLLPTGVYTIPEVSMIGETEESLTTKKIRYVAGRASYSDNARGQIIGDKGGFLKLLFSDDDEMKLLGVHVIGEQATEVVHIGVMAMLTGSGWELFNTACFNYPTLGELYKHAAYEALVQRSR